MSSAEEDLSELDKRIRFIQERLQADPQQFLSQMDNLEAEVNQLRNNANTPSISEPIPISNPPPPTLDPQIMAMMQLLLASKNSLIRSEKLPDITEYEGEEVKLDAWEQSLIQRMHVNNDRYPFDQAKIAYAESRLTIGKKAHNLMNAYRVDGLCILTSFVEWRSALRRACGNPYEQEDARKYLRDILKQGSSSFEEYYNLFAQKKDRSKMEDASLIDAMKANVNYSTQTAALMYRVPGTQRQPTTFDEHVTMWLETDRGLRQIRHIAPKANTTTITPTPKKPNPLSALPPTVAPAAKAPVASPASPALLIGDPMDLSSAMAAVKGQSLKTEGVRKICEDWKLCFYCKLQHPGKSATDCPNKRTNLRSMELEAPDIDQGKA